MLNNCHVCEYCFDLLLYNAKKIILVDIYIIFMLITFSTLTISLFVFFDVYRLSHISDDISKFIHIVRGIHVLQKCLGTTKSIK